MARQPNGRSGIKLGADGRYHAWVTVGVQQDGTLDRKHISGKTATAVSERIEHLKGRQSRGASGSKIDTVGGWLEYWLENIVRPNRAYKTYRAYEAIIHLHITPRIGGWRLDGMRTRLEPEHIEQMYTELGKTLAPSYVVQVDRVLSRALKVAQRRGRASRNVCDLVDSPTARPVQISALSFADAQAVVLAAVEDDMAARWLLGILNGLRQGETLGARWHYLDLEAGTLMIPKQLQRQTWRHGCEDPHACAAPMCAKKRRCKEGCRRHTSAAGCPPPCPEDCTDHARLCPQRHGGGLVEIDTKSGTGAGKPMPLEPITVELLRARRERQIIDRANAGMSWDPKGLVFTNLLGAPIDPRRDHSAWEQLLVSAGVADARLHAARHTAATLMVAAGADISVVQELLRHAKIQTTRGYVDVANNLKREAVEKIANSLFDGQLIDLLKSSTAPNLHRSI